MTEDVVTVTTEATLRDAAERMTKERIGSVLVADPTARGILTETDAVRAGYRRNEPFSAIPVTDEMTPDVVTIDPEASLRSAVRTMTDDEIKRLPVVDGIDLVGIVTVTDLAHHLPDKAREVRGTRSKRDGWGD